MANAPTTEYHPEPPSREEILTPVTRTATVITRHSAKCIDRKRGTTWRKCACRKSLVVYDDGRTLRISAKTRAWEKAEKLAQQYRDGWDPEKQELKRLRAAKEQKDVRVEDAVALYTSDMVTRLGDNGTVAMMRSLVGDIDPDTKAILNNGRLFNWLDTLPPGKRPTFITEFTPAHLTAWRSSWKFGSDLTGSNRWGMVRGFFNFCEAQGWIENSPARLMKSLPYEKGNRTAIFTDEQYIKVLDTIPLYDPENTPAETRKAWRRRLTVFIELLRWSGMALIDATQYRPDLLDSNGVLRYRRQKTDVLATVPLPEHVTALLRDIPLERDSVGPEMPFRSKDTKVNSDISTWARRLNELFKMAGIIEVRTEQGRIRRPHPHMLRDTFAVWHLRHGARLHTVAKMLGHSKTTTTERAYLPWVKELEEAHIADAPRSLPNAEPQLKKRKKAAR